MQNNGQLNLPWQSLTCPTQTVVFYMGLHNLQDICTKLVEAGQSDQMPAAIVSRGTSVDQDVLVGTLATLVQLQGEAKLAAPALIIVGKVVLLQAQLQWFGANHLVDLASI